MTTPMQRLPAATPLLVDTDPGIDDAFALALMLRSPEVDVLGISTVFGNGTVELLTGNALALTELLGRPGIPVAKGAAVPLTGRFAGPAAHVHGLDGMGDGNALPVTTRTALPDVTGAELIVRAARERPGELAILALGPLTNLALALALDPELPALVRQVVVMGGNALAPGNATPAAEANIFGDPEAADRVFGADWPVTMVGLEVTHRVQITGAHIDRLARADSAVGTLATRAVPHYRAFYENRNRIDGLYLHDMTAAAVLLWPDLFTTSAWPIRVETQGFSRGKTWPSLGGTDDAAPAAWAGRPRIAVCTDVDAPALIEAMLERLLRD